MDGLLDPSKLTLQEIIMSDGKNLTGFNEVKPVTNTTWSGEQYAADPDKNFSATDKSTQDGAGLGNGGK